MQVHMCTARHSTVNALCVPHIVLGTLGALAFGLVAGGPPSLDVASHLHKAESHMHYCLHIHACLIATYVFFCGMPNQYILGTIYWMLRVAHPPLFFTCASLGQCGRNFRREATKQLRATVSEVYSAPRVTATAGRNPRLGIMPGLALCSGRD